MLSLCDDLLGTTFENLSSFMWLRSRRFFGPGAGRDNVCLRLWLVRLSQVPLLILLLRCGSALVLTYC